VEKHRELPSDFLKRRSNTADGCLRRQVELFADGTIKQILQVMLPGLASTGPLFGNFVAGGIARSNVSRSDFARSGGADAYFAALRLILSDHRLRDRRQRAAALRRPGRD
jgi:hypothetical protein